MRYLLIITTIFISSLAYPNDEQEQAPQGQVAYEKIGSLDSFVFGENKDIDFEVLYFFSYACPSCYRFHDAINEWKQNNIKDNIRFRSVPVVFQDFWEYAAKLHFIGNALDVNVDDTVYEYHHEDGNYIVDDNAIIDYFITIHDLSREDITPYLKSSAINKAVSQSMSIADQFDIPATPFFVVIDSDYNVYRISHRTSNTDLGVVLTLTYLTKPSLRPLIEGEFE